MIRRRSTETPEVPIAPMLDMAFNLLTFFILTFEPAPMELQFNLNLLPSTFAAEPEAAPPEDAPAEEPAPVRMLTVTLSAGPGSGDLQSIRLEELEFSTLDEFEKRLTAILSDPDLGFDQAEIRVDPDLQYQYLIEVINIFVKNKLTKISFTASQ